ncbi:MAG: hypothetical protein KGJ09_00990 [Candidatus Omnitrophica bacterium]|nr:hypothetical protein [Candidatus Omnitrophota bacterium]MDE2008637.1 hypothetical protein [Candidatus Omnitrophota bacterium]MDE2214980.1 hypothetical protein [Candidatus Omnitrophota bacterium]MDE2230919.1 hypothetical protein [Candidatus Omnitrophota bacterium]
MKKFFRIQVFTGMALIFLSGCQTAPPKPKPGPSRAETISALTTVTEGLTNKPVSASQLKNLEQQVERNPDARSALRSINTALAPEHSVKYCPENGERFSPDMVWCPDHKVKLEWVN